MGFTWSWVGPMGVRYVSMPPRMISHLRRGQKLWGRAIGKGAVRPVKLSGRQQSWLLQSHAWVTAVRASGGVCDKRLLLGCTLVL